MSVAYKILQEHPGGNHSALIVTDLRSCNRLGIAYWDPARGQFAFSPDNQDLVLSAADQTALVTILNGLSR
jgi:hypothetical protein